MNLALFGLDKTLICENSTSLWLRWLVSQGYAPSELPEKERALITQYYQGPLSLEEYRDITLAPLAGRETFTVTGWIRRFIHRDIMPCVYPSARERITWHPQRGDTVMIISASGEYLVIPVAQRLGIHGALATGVGIPGDRYSGKTYGTMVCKEGKVTRVTDWRLLQ